MEINGFRGQLITADHAGSRGFFASLERFRAGVYVNFLGADRSLAGSARRTETPSTTGWRA
jgi:hypothetical protein